MAVRTKWQSRVGRLALLALLTGATSAGVLGARNASAGWHSAATSLQSSARVRITSKPLFGLYPGVKKELTVLVHNRDRRRSVLVKRLRVRYTKTSRRGCTPFAAEPGDPAVRRTSVRDPSTRHASRRRPADDAVHRLECLPAHRVRASLRRAGRRR